MLKSLKNHYQTNLELIAQKNGKVLFGNASWIEEKLRVSVSSVTGNENPVTGISEGESTTPEISFTLQNAVGGDWRSDPMVYLSQKVQIGELIGGLTVWGDGCSFQIANTKNISKYDDVCNYIKMNFLRQFNG